MHIALDQVQRFSNLSTPRNPPCALEVCHHGRASNGAPPWPLLPKRQMGEARDGDGQGFSIGGGARGLGQFSQLFGGGDSGGLGEQAPRRSGPFPPPGVIRNSTWRPGTPPENSASDTLHRSHHARKVRLTTAMEITGEKRIFPKKFSQTVRRVLAIFLMPRAVFQPGSAEG